eukprot:SAG31_NODE_1270_length_9065_cov_7.007473_1_plen_204_part_00
MVWRVPPTLIAFAACVFSPSFALGSTSTVCTLEDSILRLTEIAYHSEPARIYLGSPSILRLPSGELIASADRFGPGFSGHPRNVSIYRDNSSNGTNWQFHTWVIGQYWSNLFAHKSAIWMLGTATDGPAPIKISKSLDGLTWPKEASAVLSNATYNTGPVCNPSTNPSAVGRWCIADADADACPADTYVARPGAALPGHGGVS